MIHRFGAGPAGGARGAEIFIHHDFAQSVYDGELQDLGQRAETGGLGVEDENVFFIDHGRTLSWVNGGEGSGLALGACRPLIVDESSSRQLEVRSVGAALKIRSAAKYK